MHADIPRQAKSHRSDLRRGLQLVLAVVATTWLAAPTVSRANAINYMFSNASTDLMGTSETITGSFTYDTSIGVETAVNVTLTGPAPYAGTFTESGPTGTNGSDIFAFDGSNNETLIGFTSTSTYHQILSILYNTSHRAAAP
jgi:hypothetical protein